MTVPYQLLVATVMALEQLKQSPLSNSMLLCKTNTMNCYQLDVQVQELTQPSSSGW